MEESIEAACASRQIPGVVLLASDKTGDFQYSRSFGVRSLQHPEEPLTQKTPMWIASFTKLMTTIAVLQCVEERKLSLDTDVTSILHELEDLKILTGFDESGKPFLEGKAGSITVQHLLTHTSGMSYDYFHPLLQRWRNMKGEKIAGGKTIVERFFYPIVYEPGTSWEYSSAFDWAGKLVERVNGNQTLTEYMECNIWTPLGLTDVTFHPEVRKDVQQKMADLSVRDMADDGKMKFTEDELLKGGATDDMGGGGAFASPADYMKIMRSLLANDGKLLKRETVDHMFEPQLKDGSQKALMEKLQVPAVNLMMGALPPAGQKNWAFAGLMNCEDIEGRRQAGAVSWTGLPNMNWWIDRAAGLCGLYAPQCLPPGDSQCIGFSQAFEREMYRRYRLAKSSF